MAIRLFALLCAVLFAAHLITRWLYRRRLQKVAPRIALGLYPAMEHETNHHRIERTKFLLQRRYRSAQDPSLTRLGDTRLCLTAGWILLLIGALIFLSSGGE